MLQLHGKNPLCRERLFPLTLHRYDDCNAQSAAITHVAEVLPKDLFTLSAFNFVLVLHPTKVLVMLPSVPAIYFIYC